MEDWERDIFDANLPADVPEGFFDDQGNISAEFLDLNDDLFDNLQGPPDDFLDTLPNLPDNAFIDLLNLANDLPGNTFGHLLSPTNNLFGALPELPAHAFDDFFFEDYLNSREDLPEHLPAPANATNDADNSRPFNSAPTPPLLPVEGSPLQLPAGPANTLALARLQPLLPEIDIHAAARNPPAPDMFSDLVRDDTFLDPATQVEMASPALAVFSSPVSAGGSLGPTRSVVSAPATTATANSSTTITMISKEELEKLRRDNRILRSHNVSIFQQRNEMEARGKAAEEELAMEKKRRARCEEIIRLGDGEVARLMREQQALVERLGSGAIEQMIK